MRSKEPSPGQLMLVEVLRSSSGAHEISGLETLMWNEIIDKYGDAGMMAFLRHHVSQTNFPPHPSQALKFFGASNDAATALLVVQRAVERVGPWENPRFEDPAIAQAIVFMGGWVKVCEDFPLPADRFAMQAFHQRFEAALRSAQAEVARRHLREVPLLGQHAINSMAFEERLALGNIPQTARISLS